MSEELEWITPSVSPEMRAEVERTAHDLFDRVVTPRLKLWWPHLRARPAGTIPVAAVSIDSASEALRVNLRAATPREEIPGLDYEKPEILRRVAQLEAAGECPVVLEIKVFGLCVVGVAMVARDAVGRA